MMFDFFFREGSEYIYYESLNWWHASQSDVPVVRMRQEWKLRLLIYRFTDLNPMKCKEYASGHILHNKTNSIYRSLVDLYGTQIGVTFFHINSKKKYQRSELFPADQQMILAINSKFPNTLLVFIILISHC